MSVIVMSPEELRTLIREEVRAALAEAAPPADDTLIDVKAAAELTGRTEGALYKQIKRGTLPGVVRQGGRVMLRRGALVGR